jgi:ribose transport system substrate-binding protein
MLKARRIFSIATAAVLTLATLSMTACNKGPAATTSAKTSGAGSKPYIAIVAKGFQFQYWQVVMQGAQKAAKELNVTITFDGPPSESDISTQVNMLNADLAKHPVAICLAALDTSAVKSQLAQAQTDKIPVIGFDSGVPDAPKGQIAATAATDSYKAAALAADKMFADASFLAKVKAATAASPVAIGVLSQDATSASVTQRTKGFLDEMKKNIEAIDGFSGAVEISGQANYNAPATSAAKVKLEVNVPPTTSATDLQNGAKTLLAAKGIIAIYGSNQGAADGILAASSDGSDFAGKFKGIVAVGFDAGKGQKKAVENGWFLGSITQDPFQIGYDSVQLAYKAYKGETVADMDTGAKWYDKTNMTSADIKDLLYD